MTWATRVWLAVSLRVNGVSLDLCVVIMRWEMDKSDEHMRGQTLFMYTGNDMSDNFTLVMCTCKTNAKGNERSFN